MSRPKTLDTQVEQRYKDQITYLKKTRRIYYEEMAERGKEIEKFSSMLRAAEHMIPEEIYDSLITVIDFYEARNTQPSDRHRAGATISD